MYSGEHMGPPLVWTVGLFLSGMDAPPRTEGRVPFPGSRQIGPRQIGPLADLAANFAQHFFVLWQIGPLENVAMGNFAGKLDPKIHRHCYYN